MLTASLLYCSFHPQRFAFPFPSSSQGHRRPSTISDGGCERPHISFPLTLLFPQLILCESFFDPERVHPDYRTPDINTKGHRDDIDKYTFAPSLIVGLMLQVLGYTDGRDVWLEQINPPLPTRVQPTSLGGIYGPAQDPGSFRAFAGAQGQVLDGDGSARVGDYVQTAMKVMDMCAFPKVIWRPWFLLG